MSPRSVPLFELENLFDGFAEDPGDLQCQYRRGDEAPGLDGVYGLAAYADGIGWGDAKQQLFELINAELAEKRDHFAELTANPSRIEDILQAGAAKARKVAHERLQQVREAVGIRPLK